MRNRTPSSVGPGKLALVAGVAVGVAVAGPGAGATSGPAPLAFGPAAALAAETGTPGAGTAGPGAVEPGGRPLATVDGIPITREEFDREVERLPEQYRSLADTPEGRRQILDNLVLKRLLWKRAREQGLDRSPEVRADVEAYAQQAAAAALVERAVASAGADMSDDELKAYYDSHLDEFRTPAAVRASHILVETEAEAERLRGELANGKDFAEAARQASKDASSAARGGDLGFFTKDQVVPEFAEAAFSLEQVGDVSPVVKTQFGYHIIKLTDRRPAALRPFDEVKEPLEAQLREERQRAAVEALLDEVRRNATIEIDESQLAK